MKSCPTEHNSKTLVDPKRPGFLPKLLSFKAIFLIYSEDSEENKRLSPHSISTEHKREPWIAIIGAAAVARSCIARIDFWAISDGSLNHFLNGRNIIM